jgi:hypothetical protein
MTDARTPTRNVAAVIAVVGLWVLFALITDNWWRKAMVAGVVVEGVAGLLTLETVGAVPHLLFFLFAGWCVYLLVGPEQGFLWVTISAGATVLAKLVLTRHSFGQLDAASFVIILANYAFPFLFALAGGFLARRYVSVRRHHERAET